MIRTALILTLITGLLSFCRSNAQGIIVKEAPAVAQLMQKFIEYNRTKPELDGWRIQLLATTDRQKVESEKTRFQSLFPNIAVDWVHSKPYYKLRAGAYTNRLDIYQMLYVIRKEYPGAYPAADKLKPEELVF